MNRRSFFKAMFGTVVGLPIVIKGLFSPKKELTLSALRKCKDDIDAMPEGEMMTFSNSGYDSGIYYWVQTEGYSVTDDVVQVAVYNNSDGKDYGFNS